MIDPNGIVGELIEQGQQVAQSQASDLTNRLKGQVIGVNANSNQNISHQAASGDAIPQSLGEDAQAAQRTREMVKDFYSASDPTPVARANPNADQEKLSDVRKQLQQMHRSTYYDPLFAYEHDKKPTKQEEQEEEKKQKMQELEEINAKKDQNISVQMAAQKTERFPGMSG